MHNFFANDLNHTDLPAYLKVDDWIDNFLQMLWILD